MAILSRITVYPIKALDGIDLKTAIFTDSGALRHDREFAIFDSDNNFVNGKRNARVHSLHANYSTDMDTATLSANGVESSVFRLRKESRALESMLTNHFGFVVRIKQNENGFPDDTDSPGPTVISTATLETVASWFPTLKVDDVRRRFRANLEIGGVPPFWEDRLYAEAGLTVPFRIGETVLEGVNPCQRCIVPTRDPESAAAYVDFQKVFMEKRKATLPDWASADRFNHYYRLAVNTRAVAQGGKQIRVGDRVDL